MSKKITKAVLIAGGYSTRMLPFTRLVPKELLPLNGVPVINILIDECADAGIQEIYVVTRPDNKLLEDYYKENDQYREYLVEHKKDEYISRYEVEHPSGVRVEYIQEDESLPYGDALGLLMLKDRMQNEDKFLVLFADDVIFDSQSNVKKLIEHAEGSDSVVTLSVAQKKDKEEMMSFGNVYLKEDAVDQLSHIIRKPKKEEINTNLVMCGQSVLSNLIYEYYDNFDYNIHPELDTSVTVSRMATDHFVDVIRVDGHWVTVGDPQNYLKANIASHVLSKDMSKEELINYIKEL